MKKGDIVTRISYNHDLQFLVKEIHGQTVVLSGLHERLYADAPMGDLVASPLHVKGNSLPILTSKNGIHESTFPYTRGILSDFSLWFRMYAESAPLKKIWTPGASCEQKCNVKILHIDGCRRYLKECLTQYKKCCVSVIGYSITEKEQPHFIYRLLEHYNPNILVITGHDSLKKTDSAPLSLDPYINSKYFVESVKIARAYNSDSNDLVIIAGGCKSNYEALMEAGANFASSPDRILINVTEPVLIACTVAMTCPEQIVQMSAISELLPSGVDGFGGIDTRGQCIPS